MRRAALAVCLAVCCAAAQAQTAPRTTIRVGLWTLWRDKKQPSRRLLFRKNLERRFAFARRAAPGRWEPWWFESKMPG